MARAALAVLLVLSLVGAAGVMTWYLAYGADDAPPASIAIDRLRGRVDVGWDEHGAAFVEAGDAEGAWTGLGYAHGVEHAWQSVLWRQTALGELQRWFGPAVEPLDVHARRLGFAALAQETFDALPPAQQDLLRAYADGMNAALNTRRVRRSDAFVLHELQPTPWAPWHTLATERLMAWLATSLPDSVAAVTDEAAAFLRSDRSLREWLQLYGFEHSVAWTGRDSTSAYLVARVVPGATARSFVQEAATVVGTDTTRFASVPGTPLRLAGQRGATSWAILLGSDARLSRQPADTSAGPRYERLDDGEGRETLVAIERRPGLLPLEPAGPPRLGPDSTLQVDSVWTLRWAGFDAGTDLAAWAGLAGDVPTGFTLFRGDGLALQGDGTGVVLGSPAVTAGLPDGRFVGTTSWSRAVAAGLSRQAGLTPLQQLDDCHSLWAERYANRLVASLDSVPLPDPFVDEAATYLRNWNYEYSRASIAASIFDEWMDAYQALKGSLPDTTVLDTTHVLATMLVPALDRSVDTLIARYGTDLTQWRWERVQPGRLYFPPHAPESLRVDPFAARTRYAPLDLRGRGHPTTPCWGPSPLVDGPPASALWEGWIRPEGTFTFRRRSLELEQFLGRYLQTDELPAPQVLRPPSHHHTTLTPGS